MAVLIGKQLSRRLCAGSWRTFFLTPIDQEPYWREKFPNRIASFNEIPVIPGRYDTRKFPDVAEQWFKELGHVVKEPMPFGKYTVHLFHFEDFSEVYRNDGTYPIRQSHYAVAQYRTERKHLYGNIGLGAGQGEEWYHLRRAFRSGAIDIASSQNVAENVVDDLIKVIQSNLNDKGEIDLLPWLYRWAFESIGDIALNRRLNALSEIGNQLADKMVEASSVTDEMIALTTMEPTTMYEERYKRLVAAQDYFYSVLRRFVDEIKNDIELDPGSYGAAQNMLQNELFTDRDVITLIMDLFQGALQTTPLTALMCFYHLARNGDVQAKARKEARQRMPTKHSRYFDVREPRRYIRSVINETLRINPPIIGNGRIITKELVLGGYLIPAYTNVILHYQVASRQEEKYKDALKFNPEREDVDHTILVFGGSGRGCPGRVFALRQLYLIVAKMLRNFEISYDGGDISMVNELHNKPEKPLILRLKYIDE